MASRARGVTAEHDVPAPGHTACGGRAGVPVPGLSSSSVLCPLTSRRTRRCLQTPLPSGASVAVGGFPTLCPQGHNSGLVSLSGRGQLLLSDGFRRALTRSLRLDFTSKMAFEQIALCSPREPRFTYQVCLCRGFSCRPDLCLAVWLKSLFLGPQRKPSWVKQLPAAHYRSEGGRGVRE